MNNKEKIILGVVAVVVIAGAALAATGVISLPESAETVFHKMAQAQTAITSAQENIQVVADLTDASQSKTAHIAFGLTGVAAKGATGPSMDTQFTISGNENAGATFAVAGDIRLLDSLLYVRATQLPPIPIIPASQIMNKWFMIDPVAMYKEFGDQALADQFKAQMTASAHMPAEFYTKVYALLGEEGVVSHVTPKGEQKFGDVTARVFELSINTDKLFDFVPKYIDLYNSYATAQGLQPIKQPTQTEADKAAFEKIQAQVKVANLTIAIGKKDYLPYHATATITLNNLGGNTTTDASDMSPATGVNGTITLDATYSNYNQAVTIDKPTDSVPLEQFLGGLMGGTTTTTPVKTKAK